MTSKKNHNKKRNVGIIYEQLCRKVSECLVEGDKENADVALEILKNHFKKGSELYKEFRLFNSLVKTTVTSDSIAGRILEKAQLAASDHDATRLNQEKSMLIREINHKLDGNDFYQTRVPEYRTYATIQTLLNNWRSGSENLGQTAEFEQKICEWLVSNKAHEKLDEMKTTDVNKLTVKIMREKFNKKYNGEMSASQQNLIKEFVFTQQSAALEEITNVLKEEKDRAQNLVTSYKSQCDNRFVKEKIPTIEEAIRSLDPEDHRDDNVAKFLTVMGLCEELQENKNE